jgi:hypothetical protein
MYPKTTIDLDGYNFNECLIGLTIAVVRTSILRDCFDQIIFIHSLNLYLNLR